MAERESVFASHLMSACIAAAGLGILSTIIGSFSIAGTLLNTVLQRGDALAPVNTFASNALFLVSGEIFMDLSFSICAVLFIVLNGRVQFMNAALISSGAARALLLIFYLMIFWDPGWSQILDPAGFFVASLIQVILGFIQSFAFIYAGIRE